MFAPIIAGALAGYIQLQSDNRERAIQHFQRGLGYLAEHYPELAYAEFEVALRYDSSYEPAQAKLSELQVRLAGKNPSSSEEGNVIGAKLLDEARRALTERRWLDAIQRLEQVKALKSDYQSATVNDMLYQSYVESGKEAAAAGQIEVARERFESALVLRRDPATQRQRDLALLYLDGQQAVGYDWATAIQKFTALYQQDPNYNDVKRRLMDAREKYGDLAARQNAWCLAAREYDTALAIAGDAQIAQKSANAMARCRQAIVATPTPAPPITPGGESYRWTISTASSLPCAGSGDISGSVRDQLASPLVGYYVAYESQGINRVTSRTDANGHYKFTLGKDSAFLQLFVLGGDGKTPASIGVNIHYPGGNNPMCHLIVDWQKIQ